jgi:hypothetical protein
MKLIVSETAGQWAMALRRLLSADALPLCETRTLAECKNELTVAPTSIVLAELNRTNAASILGFIADCQRRMPQSLFVVAADCAWSSWQAALAEAGAALTIFSTRKLTPLITAIHRHQARFPQPTVNVAERIWAELPLA